jgi:AcrR family transcriptional regulator
MAKRMNADDARALLVAATVELLKTRSADALSVRDVAAEAGLNHGLVHRYFGSKAALIAAAVQQVSAEIHRGSDDTPAMSGATFAYLRAHPEVAVVMARAAVDGQRPLLAAAAPSRARLDEIVAPIRAALARAGLDGAIDPYVLNALGSAALLGWFVFRPMLARGFGLGADADEKLAQLLAVLDGFVAGLG